MVLMLPAESVEREKAVDDAGLEVMSVSVVDDVTSSPSSVVDCAWEMLKMAEERKRRRRVESFIAVGTRMRCVRAIALCQDV